MKIESEREDFIMEQDRGISYAARAVSRQGWREGRAKWAGLNCQLVKESITTYGKSHTHITR
jgi:hypothetical protein